MHILKDVILVWSLGNIKIVILIHSQNFCGKASIYGLASMIDACMYLSRKFIKIFGNNPTGIFAKIVFKVKISRQHTHLKNPDEI